MGRRLAGSSSTMAETFRSTFGREAIVGVLVALAIALAYAGARSVRAHRELGRGKVESPEIAGTTGIAEPAGRRFLRLAFGGLWIFDGLLQLQWGMPAGLATQVIAPTEAGQPHILASVISSGADLWQHHPIAAATAVVWIELGLGTWLLVAARGRRSRAAGLASVGWALVVWVFGEGMGMILTSSGSLLLGAPGAVLFYGFAGGLVALPERAWSGARLASVILRTMGVVFVLGAAVQALPGRGFWTGSALASMGHQMSTMHQPALLASLVRSFGALAGRNGFGVNLVLVVVLAAIGVTLLARPGAWAGPAAAVLVSLAIWVVVEDLGFFGGLGTDPNSGVPIILLLAAGRIALSSAPTDETGRVEARRPVGVSPKDTTGGLPPTGQPKRLGEPLGHGSTVLSALQRHFFVPEAS